MIDRAVDRAALAHSALLSVPPLIRRSLLNDPKFRGEFSVTTDAVVVFEPSGISVRRSQLFDAVRAVLAGKARAEVTDVDDLTWSLTSDRSASGSHSLVMSSDHQKLVLPDFSALSGDTSRRIRFLEDSARDVNLPPRAVDKWRTILEVRALNDDEVDVLRDDIRDTPVHVERTVKSEIMEGELGVSSLVPNSRTYFERLVGAYDGSESIRSYAASTGRSIIEQFKGWRPVEGFLYCLLLSSHSALTAEISVDHLDRENLERAFGHLEKHGDMLSRVGAFEVGLRVLPDRPEVGPFLLRLVHRIRDDDVKAAASEFALLSALFILVDGELARTRLFPGAPPFYRRLAALGQASLIHRQLVQCGVNGVEFSRWAIQSRGEQFYMQSFADMRTEPRWNPDMAAARQLQAECVGRIMIAGNSCRPNIRDEGLCETIFGNGDRSLAKLCEFPRPYLPGPLEGSEGSQIELPTELSRVIEEQLESNEVNAASFLAIVNSAVLFRVTSRHASVAAKALSVANYTFADLADRSELLGILNGLATVAAVSRSPALADELRALVRRYRRDSQYGFAVRDAVRVCLVASAAREDFAEWRDFVGDWLTELAFGELEGSDGELLHSQLSALVHSVPELWVSCARADAALCAWNDR